MLAPDATRHHRQRGFTLIEMLVVLMLTMVVIAALAPAMDTWGDSIRNQATAQHAKTVKAAARDYIADNYSALRGAAGATSPATVTSAQLASGGYLPTGFNPVNPYGQTFTVKVIEPTAGKLEAMLLAAGGDAIEGLDLRRIAQQIGVDGGYVEQTGASADAFGAFGGWRRDLGPFGGSPGIGKLAIALFVSEASTQDDYLHRSATPGQPQLNRMSTAIDMAGNDVNNAGDVRASTVEATGGVVASAIAIGSNAHGGATYPYETISLRSGLNFRFNIGPVEQAMIASDGTVRARSGFRTAGSVAAGTYVDAPTVRSDESYARGWFRTQGNGGWYSERWGGGWHMTDSSWIRAYNNKNVYTGGQLRGGTVRSLGRLTADEFIDLNGVATPGGGCSPSGLLGRTSAGVIMSCVSGRWREPGGFKVSNYITGTWQPPYYASSSARIADSSWEFCALTGVMDMGEAGEGIYILRDAYGWIIKGWRKSWPTRGTWMCIK